MKSIYSPTDIFMDSMTIQRELFELLKKYGYTDYVMVIAKTDPENKGKLLYDTHYNVTDTALLDITNELVEKIENHIDEL